MNGFPGCRTGSADDLVLVLSLLDELPASRFMVLKAHLRKLLWHILLQEDLIRAELKLLDEDALTRERLDGPGRRDCEGLRTAFTDGVERDVSGPHGRRRRPGPVVPLHSG